MFQRPVSLLLLFFHASIVVCLRDQCVASESGHPTGPASSFRNFVHEYEAAWRTWANGSSDVADASTGLHPAYTDVIARDLEALPGKISQADLERARQLNEHLVTYRILDGRLFRSPADCLFPSRCQGIEHFLLRLKEQLPDLELLVNTHDWPLVNKYLYKSALPVFSFSKTNDYYDIFFPAWTFWSGGPAISSYPTGLGRWDLMRDQLLASGKAWPWHLKQDKAFFRGSRTSHERDNLVLLSRSQPHLVDAQYTKNQAWKSAKDTLGMNPAEEVRLEDHCKYQYLFNFRGVAASFRFKHLFLCGSLVLHVGHQWKEFFYDALKPWYHYVPIQHDATISQLQEILEFVRLHPQISERIARNGMLFVKEHLRMQDVVSYWRQLLLAYSQRLDFRPASGSLSLSFVEVRP